MLPEPERVANVIRRFFRSSSEKEQEAEIERNIQIRKGKSKLMQFINEQKKNEIKLKTLAKKALSLNDENTFRQVGTQLVYTQNNVVQWEKYMISLSLLETKKDQAEASVELIKTVKATTESLITTTKHQNISGLKEELERGIATTANLDERIELMMGWMGSEINSRTGAQDDQLDTLEKNLTEEIIQEEKTSFDLDARIEELRTNLSGRSKQ